MLLRAAAVSIAIHASLFILFERKLKSRPQETQRWVEVAPAPPPGKSVRRPRGKGGTKIAKLSFSDLGIRWRKNDGIALPFSDESSGTEGSQPGDGEGYGVTGDGTGGDWVSPMKLTVVRNTIHALLDETLSYPAEILAAGIEGVVKAEIWFSPLGVFVRSQSRFESASRYLRVLVIRAVKQAFAHPIAASLTKGAPLKIRCLFEFELTRRENPLHAALGETPRNAVVVSVLSFYRAGSVIGSWKLGPLAGYGILPVVGVDPGWFVDQAEKVTSDKARIDPLEKYRQDPDF